MPQHRVQTATAIATIVSLKVSVIAIRPIAYVPPRRQRRQGVNKQLLRTGMRTSTVPPVYTPRPAHGG